jgi:hypothetical protein
MSASTDGVEALHHKDRRRIVGPQDILQVLAEGHQVRTTVRSMARQTEVRALLKQGGTDPAERLFFFAADLEKDAGWAEAVAGWLGLCGSHA